jgi:D-sedoheptulose 7-phosphate isomerase
MNPDQLKTINNYLAEVGVTLTLLPVESITQVIDVLGQARDNRRSVFLFGNGGSAATASHFASDLAKGTICSGRPRLKAFALTDNVPLLCAWANDSAYENVFAGQLENLIEAGDVAIAISSRGDSANVLNGVRVAKARRATTIGFIGFDGGKLKELVDVAVVVPCHNMWQVEDIHLLLEHVITTCLGETR